MYSKNINELVKHMEISPRELVISQDIGKEILDEFIESTESNLDKLERAVLQIENNIISRDDFIKDARRLLHNLKGESGMMDFTLISNICHNAESLLFESSAVIPLDTLLLVKDWVSRAVQVLRRISPVLSEYLYAVKLKNILRSAQIDLLDLSDEASNHQTFDSLIAKIEKVCKSAQQEDIETQIAGEFLQLLISIQKSDLCVISRENYLTLSNSISQMIDAAEIKIKYILS